MQRLLRSRTALRLVIGLIVLTVQITGLVLTFEEARRVADAATHDVVRSQVAAAADALRYRFEDTIRELRAGVPVCVADRDIVAGGFSLTADGGIAGVQACPGASVTESRVRELGLTSAPALASGTVTDETAGTAATAGSGASDAPAGPTSEGIVFRYVSLTPEEQYASIVDLSAGFPAPGFVLDLGRTLDIYVSEVRIGEVGSMWAVTADGHVLWDVERSIIGSPVLDLHADYPELLAFDRSMLDNPIGTGSYTFIHRADGREVSKLAAWEHVSVADTHIPLILSVSPDELSGGLEAARRVSVLLVAISASIIVGYFLYALRRELNEADAREHRLEVMVAERTRRLSEREAHFRTLFESGGQPQVLADADTGRIVDANSAAAELWRRPREELIGAHQSELHPPPDQGDSVDSFQRVGKLNAPTVSRNRRILTGDGVVVPVDILTTPLSVGERRFIFGAFVDMSEERRRERELQERVEERSRFLNEVVHRTKNNLALISSMLSLQAQSAPDEWSRNAFESAQDRVRAMVELQTMLTVSDSTEEVALDSYLERVARRLVESGMGGSARLQLHTRLEPLTVAARLAVSLGLVTNELVTNAVKYAFPDRNRGELRVELSQDSGKTWRLTVADNGTGLPREPRAATTGESTSGSLGLMLIRGIVSQVGGSVELTVEHGTRWEIFFPADAER